MKNHKNIDVRRTAKLNLLVAEPEIVKIHGPLKVEYQAKFGSKMYKKSAMYRVASTERIYITIKDREGRMILNKKYTGRALGRTETFTVSKWSKKYYATINYTELRSLLLKPPGSMN